MENRTAVVTGSSRGIGRGIAVALAKNGYNIVVNYKQNKSAADLTAQLVAAQNARVIVVQADVSDPAQVDRLYRTARENFGCVDTLVSNAGIARGGLFIDHSDADFDEIFSTNLRGTINVCRRFLPDMLSLGFGRIINISSVWGVTGAAMESLYATSKAAIIGLTKSLAKEYAAGGITVNAIAPGAIDTDMLRQLGDDVVDSVRDSILIGRVGTPADVAAAAVFLASIDASYITGQVINLNGSYIPAG